MINDKLNDIINSHSEKSTLTSFCLYVRDHLIDIPDMTIDEIAANCYVSKGQISKMVKALDYVNYEEFKHECIGYIDSLHRRKTYLDQRSIIENNCKEFTKKKEDNINYMLEHLSYTTVNQLLQDIQQSEHIYLYGRGDARSHIYNLERELGIHNISCQICDAEFKKVYDFKENDLLIYFSTNGDTLTFDKRIYKRVEHASVKKWMITCNHELKFENILYLTSIDKNYNEYVMRHLIDLLILNI